MGKFFNTDNQLSSSFVTQMYLDRDGFIWATTRDGINRYDGYQFRVFRRENEADKTLASNYVNTMMQDRNGLFYFGIRRAAVMPTVSSSVRTAMCWQAPLDSA